MYYIVYRSFDCRVDHGETITDSIGWIPYNTMPNTSRRYNVLKVIEAPEFSWRSHKDDKFTEYFPETHHHDCGLIDYL